MNRKYIGVDEVCELTGLARGSIYQYTCKKIIPHKKFGKLVRFEEQKILDWMDEVIEEGVNIMGLPLEY